MNISHHMKHRNVFKTVLDSETRFTNRHLSKNTQFVVGILFYIIFMGFALYLLLSYEDLL